jgi:hypothetical protein
VTIWSETHSVASLGKSSTICNLSVVFVLIVKPSEIVYVRQFSKKKKNFLHTISRLFAHPFFVVFHVSPRGHFFFRNCLVGATVSLRVPIKPRSTNKEEIFKGKKELGSKGNKELCSSGKKELCSLDNKKSLSSDKNKLT